MSILEKLAMMPKMDVDPSDDELQSPCFRRIKLNRKIETDMMLLKTYQELNAKFHSSNPSLEMTTNTAAAERQMNLNALVMEVIAPIKNSDSLKKDIINDNESKTSVKAINKNKRKFKNVNKKGFRGGLCLPKENGQTCLSFIHEPIATANSFSDLVEDQNKVNEVEEANTTDIPKPRPPQPIHSKLKKIFFLDLKLSQFFKYSRIPSPKTQENSLNFILKT
ncbi:hypothetical protein TNCV_1873491 [Trichonephila clavipes]|nr:hypothetical protein TNCV_1873491 [Trichonephila clavipes]